MNYILDKDKNPIRCDDILMWGKWIEKKSNKVVKQETVGDFWVSTVFLGIDHSFGNGPPVLFETMVFNKKDDGDIDYAEKYCDRYCTWDQAVEGHRNTVEEMKAGILFNDEGELFILPENSS